MVYSNMNDIIITIKYYFQWSRKVNSDQTLLINNKLHLFMNNLTSFTTCLWYDWVLEILKAGIDRGSSCWRSSSLRNQAGINKLHKKFIQLTKFEQILPFREPFIHENRHLPFLDLLFPSLIICRWFKKDIRHTYF